jgi:hypothetical protein
MLIHCCGEDYVLDVPPHHADSKAIACIRFVRLLVANGLTTEEALCSVYLTSLVDSIYEHRRLVGFFPPTVVKRVAYRILPRVKEILCKN